MPKLLVKLTWTARRGNRGPVDLRADPFGQFMQRLGREFANAKHGELLAAQARGQVITARSSPPEYPADRAQDLVANVVAMLVIDQLEIVQVEQDQAIGLA